MRAVLALLGCTVRCSTKQVPHNSRARISMQRRLWCVGMCDADVNAACSKINTPRSRGVWSIGAVGRCLSKQLAEGKKLEKPCAKLVQVAAPKDAQARTSLSSALRVTRPSPVLHKPRS